MHYSLSKITCFAGKDISKKPLDTSLPIPEKIQTGGWEGVEEMEFPGVLKNQNVEIPGVN